MSTLLLINWTTISRKHLYQIRAMVDAGFRVRVFTNDALGDSTHWVGMLGDSVQVYVQPKTLVPRLMQLLRVLRDADLVSAAIIPPEGRYSPVALLCMKLMGIRCICVEWGSVATFQTYSWLIRLSMRICYRCADLIWFKEPYMPPLIADISCRPQFFLPNAVEVATTEVQRPFTSRSIDFLWANRLVAVRYPEWYINGIKALRQERPVRAVLMGFLSGAAVEAQTGIESRCRAQARDVLAPMEFGDPMPLMRDARFFVLAADGVFGNNALLEAMTLGVVPIVTQSPGVERVVRDGENGFVALKSESGLIDAMRRAAALDDAAWCHLSGCAIETVRAEFSVSAWRVGFVAMLRTLMGGRDVGNS